MEGSHLVAGAIDETGARVSEVHRHAARATPESWAGRIDVLILGALVLLVYMPVVHGHYAMHDDYPILLFNRFDPLSVREFWSIAFQGGRPVTVCLWYLTSTVLHDVGFGGALRLLSLAGVIALAMACAWWFRRHGLSGMQARICAVLIVCLPSCTLYAAWLVCWPYPWAAAAAVVAAVLTLHRPVDAGRVAWRDVSAIALTLLALGTYQPAVMLYWAFVGGATLLGALPARRNWLYAAFIGLGSLGAYFTAYKFVLCLCNIEDSPRSGLPASLSNKLTWLYHEVVPNVLNLWDISPHRTVTAIVGGAVLLGVGAAVLRAQWPDALSRAPLLILGFSGCAMMTYLPNLATRDNWAAYRTLLAPMTLVCLALVSATFGLTRPLGTRAQACLRTGLLGTLAFVAMVAASRTVTTALVRPLEQEFALVRYLLCTGLRSETKQILVTPPEWWHSPSAVQRYDEFGIPATFPRWNTALVVRAALRDAGLDSERFEVSIAEPDVTAKMVHAAPEVLWLDLRTLVTLRRR